jgi:hypothetical protein
MAVLGINRYTVGPVVVDGLLTRREALIESVRGTHQGLTETRLARLDAETVRDEITRATWLRWVQGCRQSRDRVPADVVTVQAPRIDLICGGSSRCAA